MKEHFLIKASVPVLGAMSVFSSCGGEGEKETNVSPIVTELPQTPTAEIPPTISSEQLVKEAIKNGIVELKDENEWQKYFIAIDQNEADKLIADSREKSEEKYLLPFDPRNTTANIQAAGSYKDGKLYSAVMGVDFISKPITVNSPASGKGRMSEVNVKENGISVPKERLFVLLSKGVGRDVEVSIGLPLSSSKYSPFKEQTGLVEAVDINVGAPFAQIAVGERIIRGQGPDTVENNFMVNIGPANRGQQVQGLEQKMTLDFLLLHDGKIAFVPVVNQAK